MGINLNLPLLNQNYAYHIDNFLISILLCGLPFSCWLRENYLEKLKLREEQKIENCEFEDILTVAHFQDLEKLFEYIREIRENAYVEDKSKQKDYLGYHLGFLCDNPYRLPSKFDLNLGDNAVVFQQ